MSIKKSIANSSIALVSYLIITLMNFVVRFNFIKYLSVETLGLNGLFTSIISVMSLAELGVGTAITFSLYHPLAEADKSKVRSYLVLFKKIYIYVSIIIVIIGILITVNITAVTGSSDVKQIKLIFMLFVMQTVSSYVLSHRKALIIADRKNFIVSLTHSAFIIVQGVIQVIILLKLKDYILFLVVRIFITLGENLFYLIYTKIKYSDIFNAEIKKLNKVDKAVIKENVYSLFIHKIGIKLVLSTDNIIITKVVNLAAVGIISNYFLIIGTIHALTEQVLYSLTSIIGNIGVTAKISELRKTYNIMFLVNGIIFQTLTLVILLGINPLIKLWLGTEYLLSDSIVIVLALNFYLTGLRKVNILFRNALGLFKHMRYYVILEVVVNIITSVLLGYYLGILGVLLGTTICTIISPLWVEPYVVFKFGLKLKLWEYFKRLLFYSLPLLITSYIAKRFIVTAYEISFQLIKQSLISFMILVCLNLFIIIRDRRNSLKL